MTRFSSSSFLMLQLRARELAPVTAAPLQATICCEVSTSPKLTDSTAIGAPRVRIPDRDREELDKMELGVIVGRRDHRWQASDEEGRGVSWFMRHP